MNAWTETKKMRSSKEIALQFNEQINKQNIAELAKLMTEDHVFISISGKIEKGSIWASLDRTHQHAPGWSDCRRWWQSNSKIYGNRAQEIIFQGPALPRTSTRYRVALAKIAFLTAANVLGRPPGTADCVKRATWMRSPVSIRHRKKHSGCSAEAHLSPAPKVKRTQQPCSFDVSQGLCYNRR